MPFEIVRNDITNMVVDAIVNTANPKPVIGGGTDARIHQKAGPELLAARQRIGDISVGDAAVTEGFNLQASYVIHTAGPAWRGGLFGEEKKLRSCYDKALSLALEKGCQSVAFPLISAGTYGFPKDKAMKIALDAFRDFLLNNEMMIYLVVFNREVFLLSEKLFRGISSYIDENYVEHYESIAFQERRKLRRRNIAEEKACGSCAPMEICAPCAPMPKSTNLVNYLDQLDAGFSETLLKLIDKTGKKDSEIYKKANLSKQHFSKIRNNPDYKPTKPTALALAIALELDLEQTKDLIGRAGYALTNSSKFDVIIRYFIEQHKYDIVEINIALYEFDQVLLGS